MREGEPKIPVPKTEELPEVSNAPEVPEAFAEESIPFTLAREQVIEALKSDVYNNPEKIAVVMALRMEMESRRERGEITYHEGDIEWTTILEEAGCIKEAIDAANYFFVAFDPNNPINFEQPGATELYEFYSTLLKRLTLQ